jgi:hypothetical protein
MPFHRISRVCHRAGQLACAAFAIASMTTLANERVPSSTQYRASPCPGLLAKARGGVPNVKDVRAFALPGEPDDFKMMQRAACWVTTGQVLTSSLQTCTATTGNNARQRTLVYPPGDYSINQYLSGPSSGWEERGVVYRGGDNFQVVGCSARIHVKGDFHKTGREEQMIPFAVFGSSNFQISGFELHGHMDSMTMDAGVNAPGYEDGILIGGGSHDYAIRDIYVHHFAGDGLVIGANPTPDRNVTIERARSAYNGRMGLTVQHFHNVTVRDSIFEESGNSGATRYGKDIFGGFSPAAGIDIEPDCSFPSTDPSCAPFREKSAPLLIERVQVLNNRGTGIGAAHGNSVGEVIIRNSIVRNAPGTDSYALSLGSTNTLVENSEIHAERGFVWIAGTSTDADNARMKVVLANNKIFGADTLLYAVTSIGEVQVIRNKFVANYTARPLSLTGSGMIKIGREHDDPSSPGWVLAENDFEILGDPRHPNAVGVIGNVRRSYRNTFRLRDPGGYPVTQIGRIWYSKPSAIDGDYYPDSEHLIPWNWPTNAPIPLVDNRARSESVASQ